MGELARRRRARDVWISRGHLAAAGVLVILLCGFSFGAGYVMGRDGAPVVRAPEPSTERSAGLPDDALVDLLARLEATSAIDGGIQDLTFPDVLRGEAGGGASAPEAAPSQAPPVVLAAPSDLAGDPLPQGTFTIDLGVHGRRSSRELQAALHERGIEAFRVPRIVDGRVSVWVGIGGFDTAGAASTELRQLSPVLGELRVQPKVGMMPR